jgi:hypothetical protein
MAVRYSDPRGAPAGWSDVLAEALEGVHHDLGHEPLPRASLASHCLQAIGMLTLTRTVEGLRVCVTSCRSLARSFPAWGC